MNAARRHTSPAALMMKAILAICLLAFAATGMADMITNPPVPTAGAGPLPISQVIAHDPVIARQNGIYYLFTTGPGCTIWTSPDMKMWTLSGRVYPDRPSWASKSVPKFNGHLWGPDISFYNGTYYLYFAVSAFGANLSCIGLATNTTLDPKDPAYHWVDHGILLQSFPGKDDWNAIDPQLIVDDNGQPYLAFGSFWSGLKLARLAPDRMSIDDTPQDYTSLASRKRILPAGINSPLVKGDRAIEGTFIYKHGGYYYLFASIGYCCRGPLSTYRMIYGRSKSVKGPYLDAAGAPLLQGGGTLLLKGDNHWYGVGGNSVYNFDGTDYLVFHGYDASMKAALPKLRIEVLNWNKDGWPVVAAH